MLKSCKATIDFISPLVRFWVVPGVLSLRVVSRLLLLLLLLQLLLVSELYDFMKRIDQKITYWFHTSLNTANATCVTVVTV